MAGEVGLAGQGGPAEDGGEFCCHALALHQVAGVHGGHHMHQRQDLPGAALPVEGNARHGAIQQGGHALGEFRTHLGVAADEVGQPVKPERPPALPGVIQKAPWSPG